MRFPRASGILLHPTSLPGPFGSGDFGSDARHFVDWLASAGQRLWQILPLGGIGPGNSPYMSTSAYAGNVLLIDLNELHEHGWLDAADLAPVPGLDPGRVDYAIVVPYRMERLARAAARYASQSTSAQRQAQAAFVDEHRSWLDDYTLFMSLAEANDWRDWCDWDPALVAREPVAMAAARRRHADRIAFWEFCQWAFFRQWKSLRAYANQRGIEVVGDAPIFIAHQSAEVWANQHLFELGPDGQPTVVAGVPPDYFSADGQRWGNPLYRWSEHAKDGYAWWTERFRRTFEMVDIVRIDHFRGFASYWEIPADEPTAVNGRWIPGPGVELFDAISAELGPLPVVAEDLGLITPDVELLRKACEFPGMRVLHFAFSDDARNPYLPHNHQNDTVVYTGTHDNDTTAGWWAQATDQERHFTRGYLATDGHDIAWTLIRAAMASVADTAIVPMQDVLALPSECRTNFPGKGEGWWSWRFRWPQLHSWHAGRLADLSRLYGRSGLPATPQDPAASASAAAAVDAPGAQATAAAAASAAAASTGRQDQSTGKASPSRRK